MTPPEPEYRDIFAPLTWAVPLLDSPDWTAQERHRAGSSESSDVFCQKTMWSNDGMRHTLELFKKPLNPADPITEAVSLFAFGRGLTGFPSIIHGGALAAIMDESLGWAMFANEMQRTSAWRDKPFNWETLDRNNTQELLKGYYVTSWLNIRFLRPVSCPGVIGVETKVLEDNGRTMKLRGVAKDGSGKELATAEGLWVKLGAKM